MTRPKVLGLLEIAGWALGVSCLAAFLGLRALGSYERQADIAAFERALPADGPARPSVATGVRGPAASVPDDSQWSAGARRRYARVTWAVNAEASGVAAAPAALLRIGRIGLEVPVYTVSSERNLNRGAVHVAGTAPVGSDGNIAIAAHRDGAFRVLQEVAVGDRIELQGTSGSRHYRVTKLAIVSPADARLLGATDHPAVTLVTCYPFHFVGTAPQRYLVRAIAVD